MYNLISEKNWHFKMPTSFNVMYIVNTLCKKKISGIFHRNRRQLLKIYMELQMTRIIKATPGAKVKELETLQFLISKHITKLQQPKQHGVRTKSEHSEELREIYIITIN